MAEGTAGGNRGAGTKRLNQEATEVTEGCVGQTWVCSSVCIAQPPPLPYLLSSPSLCIFKATAHQLVRNPLRFSSDPAFQSFQARKSFSEISLQDPQAPAPAG